MLCLQEPSFFREMLCGLIVVLCVPRHLRIFSISSGIVPLLVKFGRGWGFQVMISFMLSIISIVGFKGRYAWRFTLLSNLWYYCLQHLAWAKGFHRILLECDSRVAVYLVLHLDNTQHRFWNSVSNIRDWLSRDWTVRIHVYGEVTKHIYYDALTTSVD